MPSRRERANAIRALSMDAVQKANSGHPGAPMGMADIAEVLWRDYMQHNPSNPQWANRDRFVLSNGHGSMLIYSLLHLTGYDLGIEDLKNFRQLNSRTPGHPEYGYTAGVETTTGPLGQGIANAVGMALAEKVLAAQFNRDGHAVVDHYTYAFLGDGCMMEGISHEVASLAGTLRLNKLIAFYDDNGISIDGEVHGWFTDDTPKRFEAYGWQVIRNVDGHDADEIKTAIDTARKTELLRRLKGELPADFAEKAAAYVADVANKGETIASRKASQNALNAFGPLLPELLGGSADLAGSNLTLWKGCKGVSADDAAGNYVFYGVREFGMSAIMNGVALHGGFIPYGATFLIFMEYARNAVRMSALMKQRVLYVFTHDSIGLGEDGPTHQPIEQLASLRLTPNLDTWRPADAVESAVAWKHAIERADGPSALIFSRQNLPHQARDVAQVADIARGGYVLKDCEGEPELILIATGSEVGLAVQAYDKLSEQGRKVRVVSMPCTSVYEQQDESYKQSVLPVEVGARIAIEAAHADYWYKYVGLDGRIIGMTSFGESAPAPALFEHFGFTLDNVLAVAEELLED